jgi:hypothetical protein
MFESAPFGLSGRFSVRAARCVVRLSPAVGSTLNLRDYEDFNLYHGVRILGAE